MKKVLALALALLAVGASLISCASETSGNANDTAASDTSAETTTEDPGPKPNLPDIDLDGYTFRVLTRDTDHHIKEVYAKEQNGEILNDSVYKRNMNVENQYNVKLEAVEVTEEPESTMQEFFRTSVLAGDDVFDVALMHTLHAGATALEGTAFNWNDIEYVDFSQPWWNSVIAEEMDFFDKLYLAISDYCISSIDYTWSMLYNYKLANDYGIEGIFDSVDAGTWTIDQFTEYAKMATADLDGDNKTTYKDQFGFTTHFNSAVLNWVFSSDIKCIVRDPDGVPVLLEPEEKMTGLVEKMYDFFHVGNQTLFLLDADVTAMGKPSHDLAVADTFAEGRSLFAALRLYVIDNLRNMEDDYGIIPFPKYDEEQAGYYTHVDGHAPLMILPKTLQNTDKAGIVLEALAFESYKHVVPAVKEIVLQEKYSRDEASGRMLDLILDGRVYTFGYIYDNWKGMQWIFRYLMQLETTNYASTYESWLPGAEAQLQLIIDTYETFE